MSDNIDHPRHYTAGSIEVYDFIEAWGLDFAIGNVVKYVTRAPYKGAKLDDLKKAKWYLEKAIDKEQSRIAERVTASLDGVQMASPAAANASGLQAWIRQQQIANSASMYDKLEAARIQFER